MSQPPPPPPHFENDGTNPYSTSQVNSQHSGAGRHGASVDGATTHAAQTPPQPHTHAAGAPAHAGGGGANYAYPTSAPTPYSSTSRTPPLPPGRTSTTRAAVAGRSQQQQQAYAASRMASSSFGDFHAGHLGGGGGSTASMYSGNSSIEAAPLSSVGIPLQQRSLSTDDADVAAGLYRRDTSTGRHAAAAAAAAAAPPSSSHPQHHGSSSSSTGARRRASRLNGLDAFRDSEADFLKISSVGSLAGSTTGYLSGAESIGTLPTPPTSGNIVLNLPSLGAAEESKGADTDHREQILVLGVDIAHLPRKKQFIYCAGGVFFFSLLYGFLQELISVTLCCRQLGLFLAVAQFSGYTFWSYLLREYVNKKQARHRRMRMNGGDGGSVGGIDMDGGGRGESTATKWWRNVSRDGKSGTGKKGPQGKGTIPVPIATYLGLSILRAIDLGATNLAMQYVNYPCKTLMKSARVVFTMLFGVIIAKRRYQLGDYGVVMLMVAGLSIFMHADANSSAIFQPFGIMLLVLSLSCDGAISNVSENLMNQFNVGQDEFIFRLYSIATLAILGAATFKGDMTEGAKFLLLPGTYDEINNGEEPTWSVAGKIFVVVLFSTMGFFGSSCSAAITKHFGALTMSITSTARKATTLFLSFAVFNNECTFEHIGGIVLFIMALVMKSLRASRKGRHRGQSRRRRVRRSPEMKPLVSSSIEIGSGGADPSLYQRKTASPLRHSNRKSGSSVV